MGLLKSVGQGVVTQESRNPCEETKLQLWLWGLGKLTMQEATISSCLTLVYSEPAHLTETVDFY